MAELKSERNVPRVLLVNLNSYDQPYPVYPLSLAYLDAALTESGCQVEWWDGRMSTDTLEEAVMRVAPGYIGVSVRNVDNVQSHNPKSFIHDLVACCRRLRAVSSAKLILGGSGFSVFPRELLALADADFGVAGEGERALVELIRRLELAESPQGIPGLLWKEEAGGVGYAMRSPNGEVFSVEPRHNVAILQAYTAAGSIPGVQTQRGCPLRCCYCTYPVIEGKRSRYRTGEQLVEEMRRLKALGVNYTFVVDSVFNTNREHAWQVGEALAKADLGMEWGCFLRPRNVNRELLSLLIRGGLKHVEFGSDTFAESVLKTYGKSFTWEEIQQASMDAHHLKLHYSHFLIFGGPGETPETVEETLAKTKQLPGSYYFSTIGMRIYPDTPLWRKLDPEAKGERPSDYLLEPRFFIEPPLTTEILVARIREHQKTVHTWMLGDPPPLFVETMEKLRRRGVKGPMWEYVEILQRMEKASPVR